MVVAGQGWGGGGGGGGRMRKGESRVDAEIVLLTRLINISFVNSIVIRGLTNQKVVTPKILIIFFSQWLFRMTNVSGTLTVSEMWKFL